MEPSNKSDPLPENWKITTFGKMADFLNGYAFAPDDWKEDGTPIIRIEQLRNAKAKADYYDKPLPERFRLTNGDLIFSWSASLLTRIWDRGDAYLNQHLYKVENHLDVNRAFLKHVLDFNIEAMASETHGSTMKHITRPALLNYSVIVPADPAEQRAIADILTMLDEAIAQSESLMRKYQSIKQGLMSDLLTRGVDNASQAHLVGSVIGAKLAKWQLSDVRREFEIESGFTLGQHRRPRQNTRKYLRVANVSRWDVNLDDLSEIEVYGREMKMKSLKENDLLVIEGHANPNEIGRCAIATKQAEGLTFQNHIFRLRTRGIDSQFALIWLNSDWVRGYWRNHTSTSSGLYTINRAMLEKLPIPIPSRPEQEKIADIIFSSDQQIKIEENQLNKLKNLKQGLMQDLLSGQVRVKG